MTATPEDLEWYVKGQATGEYREAKKLERYLAAVADGQIEPRGWDKEYLAGWRARVKRVRAEREEAQRKADAVVAAMSAKPGWLSVKASVGYDEKRERPHPVIMAGVSRSGYVMDTILVNLRMDEIGHMNYPAQADAVLLEVWRALERLAKDVTAARNEMGRPFKKASAEDAKARRVEAIEKQIDAEGGEVIVGPWGAD